MPSPDGKDPILATLDVALDLPAASAGTRGVAQAVDIACLVVVSTAITVAFLLGVDLLPEGARLAGVVGWLVLLFLLQWGWFLAFELLMDGQTPGKRLLGIRVVTEEGSRPGLVPCLVRNLVRVVDFLPFGYAVGLVAMILSPRASRLGDLAAGTRVVREDRVQAQGPRPRFPSGFKGADVALVEAWFRREGALLPERRDPLAHQLLEWLRRDYPDLARSAPDHLAPAEALRVLFFPRT